MIHLWVKGTLYATNYINDNRIEFTHNTNGGLGETTL